MANFLEEIIKSDLESGRVKSVVTRFPPEPNGCLHLGHAKAVCIDFGLAEKYGGICNLRFDDTNPVKEGEEFVESIIEDIAWLGFKFNIFYASDYFPFMRDCAVKLIKKGKAYVDDCTAEEIRAQRGTLTEPGVNSKNRERPVAESLELFDKMQRGEVKDGELVLRAKIDMASPNMNMRDPVIYRVLTATHHRQGNKWRIYPMYDFAHPLEDAVEGVTHSFCTMEFEDHRPLYDWVLNECEIKDPPHQTEFARLNVTDTVMSKRLLTALVESGKVDGWDDPRLPTLAAYRRRGVPPIAIVKFMEGVGVAKAVSEVNYAQFESCIRDELNATSPRAMAVTQPIEVEILNRDEDYREDFELEVNPNDEGAGTRKVTLTKKFYIDGSDFAVVPPPKFKRLVPNGTVRLKGAYIVRADKFEEENGKVKKVYVSIIEGTRSGEESNVKVKGVIQWVGADAVTVTFEEIGALFVGEGDERVFNTESKVLVKGLAEPYAFKMKTVQFMRKGYYTLDAKNADTFILTAGLKDSYKGGK